MEENNNYSEAVSVLLEGVQTGRLQVIKLTKKQMAANKEKYTIIVADTAIPSRRKKTKNIQKPKKDESIVEPIKPVQKIVKSNDVPIKPEPPAMCKIQKIS